MQTKFLRINSNNGKWRLYQYSTFAGIAYQSINIIYDANNSMYVDLPAIPFTFDQYAKGTADWNWYFSVFDTANAIPVSFMIKHNGVQYFITHITSYDTNTNTAILDGFNMNTGLPEGITLGPNDTPHITLEEFWTILSDQYASGNMWYDN